jgi:hypothetical protein
MITSNEVNTGDRLTDLKANELISRMGYKVSGVVLEKNGHRGIIEFSAVRWLTKEEMWDLMHPRNQ